MKIMVYEDPITRQKPEDEVTVLGGGRITGWHDGSPTVTCRVRFADGEKQTRTVLITPDLCDPRVDPPNERDEGMTLHKDGLFIPCIYA